MNPRFRDGLVPIRWNEKNGGMAAGMVRASVRAALWLGAILIFLALLLAKSLG